MKETIIMITLILAVSITVASKEIGKLQSQIADLQGTVSSLKSKNDDVENRLESVEHWERTTVCEKNKGEDQEAYFPDFIESMKHLIAVCAISSTETYSWKDNAWVSDTSNYLK